MLGKKMLGMAVAAGVVGASLSLLSAPSAFAKGRPGGPPVEKTGHGTLGSPWTLKSMHDDANGQQVVGEEFEITPVGGVGQTWIITFKDNKTQFFMGPQIATVDGIREVQMTANQPGVQHMTAHAVNQTTGEVVDGFVDLPPLS